MDETWSPLAQGEVRVYTINGGDRDLTRAVTRELLAAQCGIERSSVELDYGPKGKPALRNDASLHFSIAHSHEVSVVALSRVAPLGVDVERVRTVPNAEAILRRFFNAVEIEEILSSDRQDLRFIRMWTRAEATVKVRGASLWEAATPDPSVSVRDLMVPDGYAGSVAVAAANWTLTQHAYTPRA